MTPASATRAGIYNGRPRLLAFHGILGRAAVDNYLPAVIGYGACVGLWLSDRGTTVVSGNVSAWSDLSGSGNDLSQGTGSARPAFVADAYYRYPCLRFVGASSQVLTRANTNLFGNGAYTLALAMKVNSSAGAEGFIGNTAAGSGVVLFADTGPVRAIFHPGVAVADDGNIQTTTLEAWVAPRAAAAAPTMLVNNVSQSLTGASATLLSPGASATLAIGGNVATAQYCNADIVAGAAYTSALSAAQATRLWGFMQRYPV